MKILECHILTPSEMRYRYKWLWIFLTGLICCSADSAPLNLAKIMLNYITTFTHSSSENKFFCLKNCRLLTMTLESFLLKVCVTMETARDCTFHMILILKHYNRCTSDSQSCLTLPVHHNYILNQH